MLQKGPGETNGVYLYTNINEGTNFVFGKKYYLLRTNLTKIGIFLHCNCRTVTYNGNFLFRDLHFGSEILVIEQLLFLRYSIGCFSNELVYNIGPFQNPFLLVTHTTKHFLNHLVSRYLPNLVGQGSKPQVIQLNGEFNPQETPWGLSSVIAVIGSRRSNETKLLTGSM